MSALPWIVGGLAAGVGVLYVRNRAAKHVPPGGNNCDGVAAIAATVGGPAAGAAAKAACEALGGFAGLGHILGAAQTALGGPSDSDFASPDAANKALNGAIEIPLDPFVADQSYATFGRTHKALEGSVLRFKNGCVPFRGANGWDKCVPGTHAMNGDTEGPGLNVRQVGTGTWLGASNPRNGIEDVVEWSDLLTGNTGARPDLATVGSNGRYFYKGKPLSCPKGKLPAWQVHDKRPGHELDPPGCGDPIDPKRPELGGRSPWDTGPAVGTYIPPASGGTTINLGACADPSYEFVDGFCRRKKAP